MKALTPRLRFAPSPTGFMHLGNVRAALINFLFAKQKHGAFILRIEDTDLQRTVDPHGSKIMEDLAWLGLTYDEGPIVGGSHAPYYQSERTTIYQDYLDILQKRGLVYRCFCTTQELEKKRERQAALKLPSRYDRTCACLPEAVVATKLETEMPFIWRFKLDQTKSIYFYDLARKNVHFELKNFSDFALTRQDGSFTFLFANFVDDVVMNITHIFRGEDHLSNTANQVALYTALDIAIPVFWHLPIIGNAQGKKLSKRDFGFSLNDLKDAGFLPEAICNYLAVIGGGSFEKEIMTLPELINALNFDSITSTGQVRYDLEKLKWVNHHWIMQYNTHALAAMCYSFLKGAYSMVGTMTSDDLVPLIKLVQQQLVTLADSVSVLSFYFTEPVIDDALLEQYHWLRYKNFLQELLVEIEPLLHDPDSAVHVIQKKCREHTLPMKEVFSLLRIALTGSAQGSSIKDLIVMLGVEKARSRLSYLTKTA